MCPLITPSLCDCNGNPIKSEPKVMPLKLAKVDEATGEVVEIEKELTPTEKKHRDDIMRKMKVYAANYMKRHPNTTPDKLKKNVCKKFNVKLT